MDCFDFASGCGEEEYVALELTCDVDLLLGPIPSSTGSSTMQQQQEQGEERDLEGIAHRVLSGVATSNELARSRFFTTDVWLEAIPEDSFPLHSLDKALKHANLPRKFLDALLIRMRAWFPVSSSQQQQQEALALLQRCVKQGTKRSPKDLQEVINPQVLFNAYPPHIAAEIELTLCRALQ